MTTIQVEGGELAVARWGPTDAPTAVAAHGITSHHLAWSLVGQDLAERGLGLVAPDLRGRGDSSDPGAASSLAAHADDLVAMAHSLALPTPGVVAGHSMGGFVAAMAGVRHPGSWSHVVLVDGGPPLSDPLPEGTDVEAVLLSVIGPALERLDARFESPEAYRVFWRNHPALAGVDPHLVNRYADYDLRPDGDTWRSKVSRVAILADARDTLVDPEVRTAVESLAPLPATMLHAERGMQDGPVALYPPERIAAIVDPLPHVETHLVEDVNHYTISLAPHGARAVADAIASALTT